MKKILVVALCVLMAGALTANGTFAQTQNDIADFFRDLTNILGITEPEPQNEDEFKVTLKSYQRDGNGNLVEMEPSQTPTLYPAMHDQINWENIASVLEPVTVGGISYSLFDEDKIRGAVDKFVSVYNASVSDVSDPANENPNDAYFRIAIAVHKDAFRHLHLNLNRNAEHYDWEDRYVPINIGNEEFYMLVGTYLHALPANTASPPALLQVVLDKDTTSEDVRKIPANFLQIQVMAVDADAFNVTENGVSKQLSAREALNAALPLANLNPFK